jgi:bis(5'-nucleosyl)-tetraphosphatase (symmetrical)
MRQRIILFGDPHGALDELRELVRKVDYRKGRDRLISLGDNVDRGPYPVEVVRYLISLGAESVMGNHDQKVPRFRDWETKLNRGDVKKNPMQVSPKRASEYMQFTDHEVEWIRNLPYFIRLEGWGIVVHGGLSPNQYPEQQDPSNLCRLMYVDKFSGNPKSPKKQQQPANTVLWQEAWKGPESVFYGHAVWSLDSPRIDTISRNPLIQLVGLETGVVFGGKLTALVTETWGVGPNDPRYFQLPEWELVQVTAKAKYQHRDPLSDEEKD